MTEKLYVSPNQLLNYSYQLADQIMKSKCWPNFIIDIQRERAPVGIAIQKYFKFNQLRCDHITIRTFLYEENENIEVHGLEYIRDHAEDNDEILLVDDIFDSGRSMQAILQKLKELCPAVHLDVKIATIFYKPENNKTIERKVVPDYFIETTDRWVVFPHELEDLSDPEITTTILKSRPSHDACEPAEAKTDF